MFRPGRALVSVALISALLQPAAVATAQTAPGSLSWGIRSSFDNYTGGATAITGGAQRVNNAFTFPLASNTYNADEQRSEIQFSGEVI